MPTIKSQGEKEKEQLIVWVSGEGRQLGGERLKSIFLFLENYFSQFFSHSRSKSSIDILWCRHAGAVLVLCFFCEQNPRPQLWDPYARQIKKLCILRLRLQRQHFATCWTVKREVCCGDLAQDQQEKFKYHRNAGYLWATSAVEHSWCLIDEVRCLHRLTSGELFLLF